MVNDPTTEAATTAAAVADALARYHRVHVHGRAAAWDDQGDGTAYYHDAGIDALTGAPDGGAYLVTAEPKAGTIYHPYDPADDAVHTHTWRRA